MTVSRRDALTRLAVAGAGTVLAPSIIRGQSSPIIVAGRPVEIVVRPLGEFTVRISVRPIVDGKPQPVINRGALVEPVGGNESRVETGDLVVSVREGATTTITVRRRGRIVQTLSLSRDESTIAFAIGNGPIFGLGEGGPQFDRRGTQYPSRNGQGGYQLRTHGGRVPIQWLVSTDGWGMFIHQPLGAFDLDGQQRHAHADERRAAARRLRRRRRPIRKTIMRRVRADHRIRGAAAALVVRLHAVASHARRPRRDHLGRAHVSREEAAVRRADLSRHRVHAVGMEHAQRRVRLEAGELSRSEEVRSTSCTRSTTRSCCTSSSKAGA